MKPQKILLLLIVLLSLASAGCGTGLCLPGGCESSFSYDEGTVTYIYNKPITPNTPALSGASMYSISPALPSGLSMDSATGVISGTPLSLRSPTTYTITADVERGIAVSTLTLEVEHSGFITPIGSVSHLLLAGETLYAAGGGSFGQLSGSGGIVSRQSAVQPSDVNWPPIRGTVQIAIEDPANPGGFYIGGSFYQIGEDAINSLARILPNGTLDTSWNPNPDSNVSEILVSGNTVYVGGDFNSIGGQARNSLAAVDTTTGAATAWNPDVDSSVRGMVISGNTLYIAGGFSTVNGATTRNGAAALDLTTGLATAFDPDITGYANDIAVSENTIFLGGWFTALNGGGTTRRGVAAVDATTGAVLPGWDADLNVGQVQTVAVSGSTLYVGGFFSTVNGGTTRGRVAAFDVSTAVATSWDPNMNGGVLTIVPTSEAIYLGGWFTSANGSTTRNYAAAIDPTTGNVTSWNPDPGGYALALAPSQDNIFIGGSFYLIGDVETRSGIAAIDLSTNTLTDFEASYDEDVFALAISDSGDTLYVGGDFTQLSGEARNYLGAVDAQTGEALPWDPNPNLEVYAIAVDGSTVYVGGRFTDINSGTTRNRAAAVDATTGIATAWNPNVSGGSQNVRKILPAGATVYIGGAFTTLNGATTRVGIAEVDATTGIPTAWNANLGALSGVSDMILGGSTLYIAGSFITVNGGTSRNRLAALDTTTAVATAFNPDVNSSVNSIALSGSTLYAGGFFTTANGGTTRNALAAFDATTGTLTDWDPNADQWVEKIAILNDRLFASGAFQTMNGTLLRQYLAEISLETGIVSR